MLGLFPGLFEVSLADPRPESDGSIGVLALLGTPYGRYALGHLAGSLLQILGGSWFVWLIRSRFVHAVPALCILSLGLELWGWVLKGTLSPLSAPGLVAAALAAGVYVRVLRLRAAG